MNCKSHAKPEWPLSCSVQGMSITLQQAFSETVTQLRRELVREGLETAMEWNSALDLRDTTGAQVPDTRCFFVFDPISLLHHAQHSLPAAALATVTLRESGTNTIVLIEGRGLSYRRACRALARLRRQLPEIRHAA